MAMKVIPRCTDTNRMLLGLWINKSSQFIPLPKSNVTGSGTGTLGGVMLSVLDYIMRGWSGVIS
jgi:hypothetical protein